MSNWINWFTFFAVTVCALSATAQQTVHFRSLDGLKLTADLYEGGDGPWIVLCHLAGHSRGEYRETARKLQELKYNCLALDARSGDKVLDVENESAKEALRLNKPTGFLDAEQDILAAVDFAYGKANGKPVVLLGSSYSASLALKVSNHHPKVGAVIAFSPGEHFGSALTLKPYLTDFDKPLFLTSSQDEAEEVNALAATINKKLKTQFVPAGKGAHGSIALWSHVPEHETYWKAMISFLMVWTGEHRRK